MTSNEVPRITPGMTLAVEERDYLYANGMALLIVQSVSVDQHLLSSLEWVRLDCLRLREDGSVIGPFSPMVRTRALAAAVRPTGWLPPRDEQSGTSADESMPHRRRDEGHGHG